MRLAIRNSYTYTEFLENCFTTALKNIENHIFASLKTSMMDG